MLKTVISSLMLLLLAMQSMATFAAPKKDLDPTWNVFADNKSTSVNHQPWQTFLDAYLHTDNTQQTFLAYDKVNKADRSLLDNYLLALTSLDPRTLTKAQQMPYWINLYNAKTVQLILDNYPIKSITKLGKGWFGFGPWDDKILEINGKELSLNDIEHRILRPIYNDARIHYAVNCASFGCPNLATSAFTLDNTEQLLEQAAKEYVNHSRGVQFNSNGTKLQLSSIYDWYQVDFGKNEAELLKHLQHYAQPELAAKLAAFSGSISYEYDWALNLWQP
ncbi:DUF547 domain-containing protein [Marinomonas agarivorans]|nr:DUF547 domain-containing protein [Marinomonas agarivorans]